ncbi:hypothetical protein CPC16_006847 [Podila verticillata]|nr:hypothetical protein CPC16_006847 [Podila verticillata]
MFNWTAIPDSLDNNYEEAESTSPSIPSSSATFALQNSHDQMLTRSASTSHISSSSSHLDPMSHLVSSSRLHQRTPGAGSLSEFSSPVMSSSTRLLSSSKAAGDQINGGLRAPPNSTFDTLTGAAGALAQQPSLLDPPTSNPCWWYPRKSASLPDFVLISEFSEVEGPRAVMTIPDNIVDLTRDSYSSNKQRQEAFPGKSQPQHMQDLSDMSSTTLSPESNVQEREDMFDIHEFVLRITSVDQQAREASGSFHIPEDIEVHISDGEKGYWAYVHHFTLFDINARGFVRPFCMSYITRDPHKILAHYEEIRHKFSKAALHFKTGNYTLFRQDLTKKLRDLNFTNNLLSEAPSEPRSSDPSSSTAPNSIPSASPSITTLPESVTTPPSSSISSPSAGTPSQEQAISSTTSHDTITSPLNDLEGPSSATTESQKADLESIKDAIETATHIISTLEHYSVDGQPLLGHADDGNEVAPTVPLSDLSPMTSSENLASLAAGRSGPVDPSLFLGATPRPGSRIRHKGSTNNVSGAMTSRMYDPGPLGHMDGLSAALPPHLLGLQEQSRKNSVVSEYDSMMYEAPEYEAQYVTTLYPIFRDEVTFRPLRELCIATMVWNSSIQFHLGVKKIKDILRDFQADSQLLGEASDSIKRMYPTSSSLTVGQRFMMNFCNPNFNRTSTRQTHHQPSSVPFMELLEGISLANAPPSDDGLSIMSKAVENTAPSAEQEVELLVERAQTVDTPIMPGPTLDADDADDEETGYDSLDDAASFFTAATGVATHTDTPTREAFVISPLDRSSRVAEWHQEQQIIHRAKGGPQAEGLQGHGPWAFGAGVTMTEALHGPSRFYRSHRHSAQSGTSIGIAGAPSLQSVHCPTIILDTLQRDPSLAKHLAFALLSGHRLCVMGQTESEAKVRTLVSVLSTFLPHAGFPSKEEQLIEHQHQIITWFQGPGLLRLEDMDTLRLVGVDSGKIEPKFLESDVCILDYDTLTWVHGQQYSDGIMLESIFRNMSLFSDDTSFLAFVDGKLFEILLKSFLYYHLVFHGRLYQGGSLLALPGAQSFYSSGASDDGEAFSYQNNFRSSKQSPMMPRSSGLSRNHRKNTSTYPTSTQLGATASYKNVNSRTLSLSSYESSDTEKLAPRNQDHRNGVRDYGDDSRYPQYEHREGMDMEEDEANQNGGPMQYTTSQGMRKWKKWFEYWSAKSAAMIDPALAAFGRSDTTAHLDSSGSNRRKRNTSGRVSPGYASPQQQQHLQPQQQRRSRISSSHASPGRSRENKEREKERDRERDRERSRKSTFDPFDVVAKEKASYSDYDSDLRGVDEKDAEKEAMASPPLQPQDPQQVKIEEAHDSQVHALTPMSALRFKDNNAVAGLRKLKPKRPLTLHRPLSKSSDREQEKSDAESAPGDRKLQRSLSSGSGSGPSPPPSASFRSLAGALRAMSFGQSSTSKDNTHGGTRADSPTNAPGLNVETSPRHSRELSDSNSKDIKRRGSTRAKAKAWFKAKKKRRSRIDDGELEQEGATTGGSRQSSEMVYNDDLSEEDEVGSFGLSHGSDTDDQEYRPRQLHGQPQSREAKVPSQLIQEISSPFSDKDQAPVPKEGQATNQVPSTLEELPLTIEEIAAQEPTRIPSRAPVLSSSGPSPSPMTASFGLNSSSNSSRLSSANASKIMSPTLPTSFSASRPLHSQQGGGSQRTLDSASSSSVITVARSNVQSRASMRGGHETRSELDDSEYDRRESATEYETSQETFPMTDGNGSPALDSLSHLQAQLPPSQQQSQQPVHQHPPPHPPPSRILSTSSTPSRVALMEAKRRMSLEPPTSQGGNSLPSKESLQSKLTVDTAAVTGASVGGEDQGAQLKKESHDTVTLTEEEEAVVREMIGGVTGMDDWNIIVYLATMVDVYERSKDPVASGSSEP